MEDGAPGKIVAVDFGSTYVAPAIFGVDGPEEIEMGKSKRWIWRWICNVSISFDFDISRRAAWEDPEENSRRGHRH